MADTTSKPQSSVPIPPRPSARPEGASMSSSQGSAAKGPSMSPKVPAWHGDEERPANTSESANMGPKNMSPGRGERAPGEGSREADASPQDASHSTGSGMVTMAGAGIKKTRERVEDQIYAQRDRVTSGVRTLSRALRGAGGMLEEDELVARGLHYASDKVETVAGYVAELTPNRLASDLRNVSHSKPAWFFGGAFLLGLALGRFARSTAPSAGASNRSLALRS